MFGLSFQELGLIILICFALFFLNAGLFYLVVLACRRLLKSELRVWIALCILSAALSFPTTVAFSMADLGAIRAAGKAIAFAPVTVASEFAWLWMMGFICRFVGLRRLGAAWRDMATVHFQALRIKRLRDLKRDIEE